MNRYMQLVDRLSENVILTFKCVSHNKRLEQTRKINAHLYNYEHNVYPVVQKFTTSKLDLAWCLHLSETAIKSAPHILLSIICIFRECFITLHTYYYEFTLNIYIQFSRHSQLWILQTGGGGGGSKLMIQSSY